MERGRWSALDVSCEWIKGTENGTSRKECDLCTGVRSCIASQCVCYHNDELLADRNIIRLDGLDTGSCGINPPQHDSSTASPR